MPKSAITGWPDWIRMFLRLQVAMDDTVFVRVVQRVRHGHRNAHGLVDRELLLAVEPRAQRLSPSTKGMT